MNDRAREQRRVQAVGSYGFGNFGDELFVETVQRHADVLWPGASLRTFAPSGRSTLYASNGLPGKAARLGAAALGLAWADTIAVCGGSVFQDVSGVAKLRQSALRWRRVEALGVSIGPFHTSDAAERVGSLLTHVDRLVVRDPASVERLSGLVSRTEPVLGGDLVALNHAIGPSEQRSAVITICPSAAAGSDVSVLAREVSEALASVNGARHFRVVLLALSSHGNSDDRPLCSLLAVELAKQGVDVEVESFQRLGMTKTCLLLVESAMVWSQRLHGAIVAYLAEVPFLLVGHHAKCLDFGQDIGAANQILTPGASWAPVARALADGSSSPLMPPQDYRDRAHRAYAVAGHD